MIMLIATARNSYMEPGGMMIVMIQTWTDFITQKTKQVIKMELPGADGRATYTHWNQQQWK